MVGRARLRRPVRAPASIRGVSFSPGRQMAGRCSRSTGQRRCGTRRTGQEVRVPQGDTPAPSFARASSPRRGPDCLPPPGRPDGSGVCPTQYGPGQELVHLERAHGAGSGVLQSRRPAAGQRVGGPNCQGVGRARRAGGSCPPGRPGQRPRRELQPSTGKRLATDGSDKTRPGFGEGNGLVRVWNAATGQEELALTGHDVFLVQGVSFSPDGKRLASAGQDGTVRLWDAMTGQEERALTGHSGRVHRVCFCALDGKQCRWPPPARRRHGCGSGTGSNGTAGTSRKGHTGLQLNGVGASAPTLAAPARRQRGWEVTSPSHALRGFKVGRGHRPVSCVTLEGR